MLSHSMSSQTVDKPSSQRSFCCPKARESVALMLQVKLSLLNDNDTIRLRRVSRIEAHPPFHGIRKSSQSAYFSKCDYRQLRPFLGVGEKRPDIMLTIFTFSGKLLVGWNLAERSVAYALHHERFREGRFFCDAGVSGRNCDRTETGGQNHHAGKAPRGNKPKLCVLRRSDRTHTCADRSSDVFPIA